MNQEPAFRRFEFIALKASLAAGATLVLATSALWKFGMLDIK